MRIENIEIPWETLQRLRDILQTHLAMLDQQDEELDILRRFINIAERYCRGGRVHGIVTLIEEAEVLPWLEAKRKADSDLRKFI